MPETTLSFAKIVATPSSTSWSQSYNAGSLFVVLSLAGDVSSEQGQTLNGLGKEFINTLEAEFFTLEEKSLAAIKQALTDSASKVPTSLSLSIAMVFIKQNIVYGYTLGKGKIQMRRSGQIGTILTNKDTTPSPRDIATSSGILQNKDLLILETEQFASAITPEVLKQALELEIPNDIAETLSLPIHGTNEGGAAGIVILFHGASQGYVLEQKPTATPTPSTTGDTPAPEPAVAALPAAAPSPVGDTPPTAETTEKETASEADEKATETTTETPTESPEATAVVATSATDTPEGTLPATTTSPTPETSTTTDETTATEIAATPAEEPVEKEPEVPPAAPPASSTSMNASLTSQAAAPTGITSDSSATVSPSQTPSNPSSAIPAEPIPTQPEVTSDAPVVLDEERKSPLSFLSPLLSKFHFPSVPFGKRQKIGLVLLVIILLALAGGIYYSTRTKQTAVDTTLFNKVYPEALKDYEEGEGLLSLNKNLARDDFLAAQKKLQSLQGKYEKGSKEDLAITELLAKVESQLKDASGVKQANLTELTDDKDPLLSYAKKNPKAVLTEDESFIYAVSDKAVTRIDKGNSEDKSIITNDEDWERVSGVGVYLENIYILDTENAVLKFVSTGSDYGSASSYFPEDSTPDTAKAVGMSIDGSIWLLFSDGTISKYTKGASDNFKVTGLDTPLSKPTKIITNADMEKLYVLDTGNKRIVVIDKKGVYESQVTADSLGNATTMTIDEKNKKARFLSSGKIYEISL